MVCHSSPDLDSRMAWHVQLREWGVLSEDEPMSRHTTLGVGGNARWYFRPANRQAAICAIRCVPADVSLLPLGRGSNLLMPDEGFVGLVMDLSHLSGISIKGQQVTAEAGVRMNRLSQRCAAAGLSGVEFMATIPGNVGGGIAMNAGAFGQQVSDALQHIDVVTPDGNAAILDAGTLGMAYRQTRLPAGSLVLSASFELQPDHVTDIRVRMRSMRRKRSFTQPLERPNCGSVFKNPPDDHAARLIEAAGLKGLRIGGARISGKHANFIVNEGEARSSDVCALIRHIRKTVEQRFGVRLEPEVHAPGARL